jgi:hypothetical protein
VHHYCVVVFKFATFRKENTLILLIYLLLAPNGTNILQFEADPSFFCSSFQENRELWATSWSNSAITCSTSSWKLNSIEEFETSMYVFLRNWTKEKTPASTQESTHACDPYFA